MKELLVEITKVHAEPQPWPADFDGQYFQFQDMEVSWYGKRTGMRPEDGENSASHDYRLYALEHSPEPGKLIFGIKEDMTPQCYNPSAKIVLDLANRTVQVTEIEAHWEDQIEFSPGECNPAAIFKFL